MGSRDVIASIIRLVGGTDNIHKVWHCMTRLRFDLIDDNKVNQAEIKKLPGVLGAQTQSDQFQIIIGPQVNSWYEQLTALLGGAKEASAGSTGKKERKSLVSLFMDTVSGVFGLIVPAIAGAGMIKGLAGRAGGAQADLGQKRYGDRYRSHRQRRVLFSAVFPRDLRGQNVQNERIPRGGGGGLASCTRR